MGFGVALECDALRSLASGSISGTYANIGSSFGHPVVLLLLQNLSDVQLTFSLDGGRSDSLVLPSNGQVVFDAGTNRAEVSTTLQYSIGTQISVKGSPTTGSVYVMAQYIKGT